jgi:hypothetical protein
MLDGVVERLLPVEDDVAVVETCEQTASPAAIVPRRTARPRSSARSGAWAGGAELRSKSRSGCRRRTFMATQR